MGNRSRKRKTPLRPYDDRAKWNKLRRLVCRRDKGRCQLRIAKNCAPAGLDVAGVPKAKVMHLGHIVDWATSGGSWYGLENLRTECPACSRAESLRRQRSQGWKRANTRVVLVVGPPGGDASERAADLSGPRDLIVDFDAICADHGSSGPNHSDVVLAAARAQYSTLLDNVRAGKSGARTAFIVSANPDAVEMFPHHEVLTADPGREVVDERTKGWPKAARRRVAAWYDAQNDEHEQQEDQESDDWNWLDDDEEE